MPRCNPTTPRGATLFHTHSSTVATNALIERRGARVGLITTLGFRDLFWSCNGWRFHIRCQLTSDVPHRWCRGNTCAR